MLLKERTIQIGYVLGISLIIAAIIYFFASNWPGFNRYMKISLSIGLVVLFYGLSLLLSKLLVYRGYLGDMLLFSGCISFGVSLALIGQIYNSHADSFMLFAIWFVPALLFSIMMRYQAFYVLTYLLLHLTVWFYVFPTTNLAFNHTYDYRMYLIGVVVFNIFLFSSIEKGYMKSVLLKRLSLFVFHMAMIILSTGAWLEAFSSTMSLIYASVLGLWFYYEIKTHDNQEGVMFLGFASTIFLLIKFFAFLSYYDYKYIYFITILIPIILVIGAIIVVKKTKESFISAQRPFLKSLFGGIVVALSSVMLASSIAGILFNVIGDVSSAVPYFISILIFIVPALLMSRWHSLIRVTLLLTGFIIGVPSAVSYGMMAIVFLICTVSLVLWKAAGYWLKSIAYLTNMVLIIALFITESFPRNESILLILVINLGLFLLARRSKGSLNSILEYNSLIYGSLAFFIWTFFHQDHFVIYALVNSGYFLFTTVGLFITINRKPTIFKIFLIFWFGFIIYKYYDLFWSLLNKSITFTLIGIVILITTYLFDFKLKNYVGKPSFIHKKWLPLLIVLILQLSFIGVQVGRNEFLLSHGKTIKLSLEPVDPRSFIQGDYLRLRYSISDLNLVPEPSRNEKIAIGLIKEKDGLYGYSGEYKTTLPKSSANTIWIYGRYKGNHQIDYGIEHYFISEGSELDPTKRHVAYVKVAKNGDAMIVSVK